MDNVGAHTTRANINDSVLSKIKVIFPQQELQYLIGNVFYELCSAYEKCRDEQQTELLSNLQNAFLEQAICQPIIEFYENEGINI